MKRAESLGLIKEIKWSQEGESISHLQFADDTIIFLQPEYESICNLKTVLQILQLVSGLKINLDKSSLFYGGKESCKARAYIIGCKLGEWPMSYLGAKLGTNPRRKVF